MEFSTDEFGEELFLDGVRLGSEDGEVFDLLMETVKQARVTLLPTGVSVQLCNRVVGGSSRDLYCRQPSVTLENAGEEGILAHLSTPFIAPSDEVNASAIRTHLESAVQSGSASLQALVDAGRVCNVHTSVDDEIAFVFCTIRLDDPTFTEAEEATRQIEDRIISSDPTPSLFLCHASEDKPFVDQLATALDKHALYAWYDKREILVGDSIVERVNAGLKAADFVIAVLSPDSVQKQWVQRELYSSLMRQLANEGVRVLPVLIAQCTVPALLADLKYADFRTDFDKGLSEILSAIRSRPSDT